jgi:AcrR family transcriptional regulator
MTEKDLNTEEKILNAAKEIFMHYGLYGARMQDIADKAGINKALLHYYFRNKEKLFDAVFDGALEKYFEQMTVFSKVELPLEERLYTYVDNMFAFLDEYPQMSMFIIKEISTNPEMFKQKVEGLKALQGSMLIPTLKEAFEKGELAYFDPLIFMMNLHSLVAYPFLATPIFRAISERSGETYDTDVKNRVKQSVKDFIASKLNKQI